MKLKNKQTYITTYKTIYKNKETLYSIYLCLHNLGFFTKIHLTSILIKLKMLKQLLLNLNVFYFI